ncbi:hypothetical protein LP420_04710 [Massilia sp. B-10]|nr:hypothetical protein LP420_04710 [Massilia sp. B-10]
MIVRLKGYLAWSWLGMGEDLPVDVYRQWKHWCSFPRYFFQDPEMKHLALQARQRAQPDHGLQRP